MTCTFGIARPTSSFVPEVAQGFAAQTASPVPVTTTAFYRRLATTATAAIPAGPSITTVPTTTTTFVKNETHTVDTQYGTETMEVPELNTSWSSSGTAFSPALNTTTLAEFAYEAVQRQFERICSFEVAELCDGDKIYMRAPSTLDQPPPPEYLDMGQNSHESGGAYERVHVQESTPEYMRSPSASSLPPPNWSPEPIRGRHNDGYEKDYVPELMYAPSPSSLPASIRGLELNWFAEDSDFPAPESPFSSGSSASSLSSHDEVKIESPRPRKVLTAEIAKLESMAAVMVAEQEAHARKMEAAREWAEGRLKRERTQEALRAKQASRRLRALATSGGKVSDCGASTAWVDRQEESAWHFGPVRRRRA